MVSVALVYHQNFLSLPGTIVMGNQAALTLGKQAIKNGPGKTSFLMLGIAGCSSYTVAARDMPKFFLLEFQHRVFHVSSCFIFATALE